ncbi:MAG: histidine phosphatase family protein [Candidatus Aminicenantes bacterium]|nr:histidine phosphatase family protein [Candidatus Aminicenantes bacterium]
MKKRNILSLTVFLVVSIIHSPVTYSQNSDPGKKGVRTIYLVRHGQYDHSDKRDAFTGRGLVPLGVAQARLLASRLKAMPVSFTSLTSSTMTRARETAQVVGRDFPGLELKQNPSISECTPPTWRQDVMREATAAEREECVSNIERFFQEFFVPSPDALDRHDIVVCHGNVIRYFVAKVLRVDTLSWLQMSITNCSLTIVRILPDGTMKLDAFGDYGHIPENLRTFTGGDDESKELIVPSTSSAKGSGEQSHGFGAAIFQGQPGQ